MILHKIFHLHMSVEQARQRLANVEAYRSQLTDVERADFTGEDISHWRLRLPFGYRTWAVILKLESAASGEGCLFKSLDGNVEAFGAVNFHAVRSNLTEVEFMVNYEVRSFVLRALDRVFGLGDRFAVKQLRGMRSYFEGQAPAVQAHSSVLAHAMTAATT